MQQEPDPRIAQVLAHELVDSVIEEAIGNWTQDWKVMDPVMLKALQNYAGKVAEKIFGTSLTHPNFASDWKAVISDQVCETLDLSTFVNNVIPGMVETLREKHGDRTEEFTDGLWGYSLKKIAHNTGCVAYMVGVGLEPNLLKMTPKEANEQLMKVARTMSEKKPDAVIVVDPSVDTPQDVVGEILLRTNPPDVSSFFNKK